MKKLYRKFFYIPKHAAVPERVFAARTVLSLVSVLLCLAMLCATTLAWFADSSSTTIQPIRAASVFQTVSTQAGSQLIADEETGVSTYACRSYAPNDLYTFVLTGEGNAETGYCQITVSDSDGERTYSTDIILPGEEMTLSIQTAPGATVTFTPSWGAGVADEPEAAYFSAYTSEPLYGDGDTIFVSESQWVEYLVDDETVTLQDLADFYGVDAQDILDYNGISWLEPGQVLRIPDPLTFEPFPSPSDAEDEAQTDEPDADNPDGDGWAYDAPAPDSAPDTGLSDWEQSFYADDYEDEEEESWSLWE